MRFKLWVSVFLLVVAAFACRPATESGEAVPAESTDESAMVYGTMEGIADAWNASDLEASEAFFADEFTQMPPGETARVGLDAVNAVWVDFLEANTNLWEPSISEVMIVGDLAFARGTTRDTATSKAGGEPVVTETNSLWIFRRQADGSWPMIFEFWVPTGEAAEFIEVAPPAAASSPDENAAIYLAIDTMARLWNSGDVDGSLAYFSEDFTQMPPGEEGLVGLDVIADIWRQFVAENTATWEPVVTEVQIVGDLAYARGSATESSTPRDGGETTSAAYDSVWVFKREADGSWKMCFEYWVPKETGEE
jgi:uncharacterized protein (TIGR02246 family)